MEQLKLGKSEVYSSRIIYGCMRLNDKNISSEKVNADSLIKEVFNYGVNHFDLADIYGYGGCESIFSKSLKKNSSFRNKIILTSKCGIVLKNQSQNIKYYDLSFDHIVKSVEGSLSRLKTDYLDFLLLHRPDYLLNPEEISKAFDSLKKSGKVRYFGVSNFSVSQIVMLEKYLNESINVCQIEINLKNIESYSNGILDLCLKNKISPQAWGPLTGVNNAESKSLSEFQFKNVIKELQIQSKKYNCDTEAIVLAWLLRHPSKILPVIGSTQISRIKKCLRSLKVDYLKEDWYRILEKRNGFEVP